LGFGFFCGKKYKLSIEFIRLVMKIYKFGGASVKDAAAVKNVTSIIGRCDGRKIVVVSAMAKMTNTFEALVEAYFEGNTKIVFELFETIKEFHHTLIKELMGQADAVPRFNNFIALLEARLKCIPTSHFDFEYDQIVPFGELLSTSIVAAYINKSGILCEWVDGRDLIKTDDTYRDANVDWTLTAQKINEKLTFEAAGCYLIQGFIGGTENNRSTTLGREGSDYSAAILGHVLDAKSVTIWKDVPGVLNADPRWYDKAVKIDELSYNEAIELSFYGAQVIHPKTLKPLQNKEIPLWVKSFLNPLEAGTVIHSRIGISQPVPVYIRKTNQIFVTISPRDFSFIMEEKLIEIISLFYHHRIKMNLMQNSALNFSACFDANRSTPELFDALKSQFVVRYNEAVELITIRQYTPEAIASMTNGRVILDSQVTRKVARFILQ